MKKINTFIKNGLILTISTLFLRLIAVLFNIFLSNKINSSLLGTFGIILSIFAFFNYSIIWNKFVIYEISIRRLFF